MVCGAAHRIVNLPVRWVEVSTVGDTQRRVVDSWVHMWLQEEDMPCKSKTSPRSMPYPAKLMKKVSTRESL